MTSKLVMLLRNIIFLLPNAIHSANYTVARCPSVSPSVRPSVSIIPKGLNISSNFFIILIFRTKRHGNTPTGTPSGGVECRGMKKSQFRQISCFISEAIQDRAIQWNANRKPYPNFRLLPFSMSYNDL